MDMPMIVKNDDIIAIPPGATIKELLQDLKISPNKFAKRINISEEDMDKLINGDIPLTEDIANRIEFASGVPAEFWNKLEKKYRKKLAMIDAERTKTDSEHF